MQTLPEIRLILRQVNEILTSNSSQEDLEAFLRVISHMNDNINGFLRSD